MKTLLTFFILVAIHAGLIAQSECRVKIVYSMNKTLPPSYNFKTDPAIEDAKYTWSFGDNSYSELQTPTHTFKVTDTYPIIVKIIDKNGKVCYGELKERFEGGTVPTTASTIISGKGKVKKLTGDGCEFVISLDNGLTLVPAKIAVNFQLKEGQNVEITYEKLKEKVTSCKEGTDAVILTIKEISADKDCRAYFTAARSLSADAVMMKKVEFTNLSVGEIKEIKWNFGDNTTSAELNPKHEYKEFGEYKVCLVIKTTSGCVSDYCAAVKVEDNVTVNDCKFELIVKQKEGSTNTFLFATESKTEIKTWKWSFGDGKTSTAKNPDHVYEKPGVYEVTCVISTQNSCTETRSVKLTVFEAIRATCTGSMNLTLTDPTGNICNGKAIVKLIDEKGNEINDVKYLWSNGKTGGTVENLCPDKPYTVQATVGNLCQKSISFTLLSIPVWSVSSINGQSNFSVVTPKEGVNYVWDFGNGNELTGANVNFNFDKDGVYDVKLRAVSGTNSTEYSKQVLSLKSTTGTEILVKSDIQVFPNPVKDILKIKFADQPEGRFFVEVMNINGKRAYSQNHEEEGNNQVTLNVRHLEPGIYFLRVSKGNYLITNQKIIKTD